MIVQLQRAAEVLPEAHRSSPQRPPRSQPLRRRPLQSPHRLHQPHLQPLQQRRLLHHLEARRHRQTQRPLPMRDAGQLLLQREPRLQRPCSLPTTSPPGALFSWCTTGTTLSLDTAAPPASASGTCRTPPPRSRTARRRSAGTAPPHRALAEAPARAPRASLAERLPAARPLPSPTPPPLPSTRHLRHRPALGASASSRPDSPRRSTKPAARSRSTPLARRSLTSRWCRRRPVRGHTRRARCC